MRNQKKRPTLFLTAEGLFWMCNYETRKNPLTLKSKSAAFGDIAKEWMDKMVLPTKAPSYSRCINMSLNKHILPKLKSLPLEEITPGMILSICQAIADDGYLSAAARVRQFISQIFDYAIASDLIKKIPLPQSPRPCNHRQRFTMQL